MEEMLESPYPTGNNNSRSQKKKTDRERKENTCQNKQQLGLTCWRLHFALLVLLSLPEQGSCDRPSNNMGKRKGKKREKMRREQKKRGTTHRSRAMRALLAVRI